MATIDTVYIDDIIIPNENEYNIIYTNTYWYDRIVHFVNNNLYHGNEQITNIQYYRILDFLHQFL